ncbi:MAG: HlyC/CorC family transporter [Candidatus Omnitrophica bacterium]|nr:HlyC/CorC family transporter [Candidatus Omnitrophota bacterium]
MVLGFDLLVVVIMLTLSAIFAAYEMALASISQNRIAFLVAEKKKGASDAAFMKNRIVASLTVIQLGFTLVSFIAAATGGAGVEKALSPYLHRLGLSDFVADIISLLVLVLPLTLITIIFAELVPKMIALNNKEWMVLALSPAFKVMSSIFYPIVSVIEVLVKKIVTILMRDRKGIVIDEKLQGLYELKSAVSGARASKLFGAREEKIVLSAAQLSSRPVKDIIIPVADIFMIYAGSSLMDAFLKAHLDMHTRFPVCEKEDDPQTIQGYINFKDIVSALKVGPGDGTLKTIMRPLTKIDENTSISQVLEKMMQEKAHIMLVSARESTIIGMVTLEDIIEELVGDIEDEFDRSLTHIKPYGTAWLIGGGALMTKVASTLGMDWSEKYHAGRVPTLAEWCQQSVGKTLVGGELIENDGIRVNPRKFRRRKMSEAIVSNLT